jgi:hypothetical protein
MANQQSAVEVPAPVAEPAAPAPTPPVSPTAEASTKNKDFNKVFAAFDNLVKKTG